MVVMKRAWPFLIGLLASGPTAAADQVIVCTITHTYDFASDKTSPTVGEDVFEVTNNLDGSETYSLPFGCLADANVEISSTVIMFDCLRDFAGATFQRFVKIDRITGEYLATFSKPGTNGLVHSGHCRTRLF